MTAPTRRRCIISEPWKLASLGLLVYPDGVKMTCSFVAGLALLLPGQGRLLAQTPKDVQAREVDVLRRTIAEQQSNPGQIIRTPQLAAYSTNSPFAARHVELERQYLEGKLTAKQYQKALEQLRQDERKQAAAEGPRSDAKPKAAPAPGPADSAKPTVAATSTPKPASATAASLSPAAPKTPGTAPAETSQQKTVSDVESKIDEMLRLKAAREKAALTNAVAATNAVPDKLQTKRQRLDAILKQFINGQINEADYNAQRAKIVAEPD